MLVASSAPGFMRGSSARIQLLLGLEILEDRLDDDVGRGDAVAGDIGAQPRARRGVLGRIAQALVEQLLRALERRLDELERPILQRDVEAAQRRTTPRCRRP